MEHRTQGNEQRLSWGWVQWVAWEEGSVSKKSPGASLHPEGCCAQDLVGFRRVKLLEGKYECLLRLGPQPWEES